VVTLILAYDAPAGVRTFKTLLLADTTVARTPPTQTVLLAGVALKPLPAIVTGIPGRPAFGLTDAITGGRSRVVPSTGGPGFQPAPKTSIVATA
jgi:hypothetical protein